MFLLYTGTYANKWLTKQEEIMRRVLIQSLTSRSERAERLADTLGVAALFALFLLALYLPF
jgi:hypothetical protein